MTQPTQINGATHRAPAAASPLAQVKRGRLTGRPVRVILYGADGVGKSTFASQAPNPVFLCAEDGTAQLDVARLPEPGAWSDVFALQSAAEARHSTPAARFRRGLIAWVPC